MSNQQNYMLCGFDKERRLQYGQIVRQDPETLNALMEERLKIMPNCAEIHAFKMKPLKNGKYDAVSVAQIGLPWQ